MNDAAILSSRDVRVALVGCGRISRNHSEAIERVEGLRLVSVCDSEEALAQEAGGGTGVRSLTRLATTRAAVAIAS